MATATESWYVRLPNGRTLRARSSDVVRRHLRAGRIPPESRARRPGERRWLPLQRIAEFAGLARVRRPKPAVNGAASRPARTAHGASRSPGVRGVIGELLQAFDSALNRSKLVIAAAAGIMLAFGVIAFGWAGELPPGASSVAGYAGAGIFVLAVTAMASALVTRMTLIELDRQRPDGAGVLSSFLRILAANAVVTAVVVGLLFAVRAALPALAASDWGDLNWLRDGLTAVAAILRVLLEVGCWAVIALAVLLLGPVVVIEEEPVWTSLRVWLGMLHSQLGRIYVCEAIAFLAAVVMTLPLMVLVSVAAYALSDAMGTLEWNTLLLMGGLALTPMITYLSVANVFIYINLRYEFYFSAHRR